MSTYIFFLISKNGSAHNIIYLQKKKKMEVLMKLFNYKKKIFLGVCVQPKIGLFAWEDT